MALSCLLKGSVGVCKAHSALSVVSRFRPVSSLAFQKITSDHGSLRPDLIKRQAPLNLTTAFRNISTTPPKLNVAVDHGKLWSIERYVSAALLGIVPFGIAYPNILFDIFMAVSITMHTHWGFESIAVDYVRPIIFGKLLPKIAVIAVYIYSILLLVGLLNLTFRHKGIGRTIKSIWTI